MLISQKYLKKYFENYFQQNFSKLFLSIVYKYFQNSVEKYLIND